MTRFEKLKAERIENAKNYTIDEAITENHFYCFDCHELLGHCSLKCTDNHRLYLEGEAE